MLVPLTAAAAVLMAAGPAPAHEIGAIHVHESHIAQGLGLALLATAVCLGVAFLARRRGRR